MTKRLMWSLLLAMLVIMTVSVMLTVSATSKVLTGRQELLLREVVDIVSNGYMVGGEDFVERFNTHDYRITIISPTGKILNDSSDDVWYLVSDHNALVAFLSEVVQDHNRIISTHTPFMFGELIMAGRSLLDGTVIVATTAMMTFGDTIFEMKFEIILVAMLSIVLAAVIARLLSIRIVKPLNEIDIETPDPSSEYKEIRPLLAKIWDQKIDISKQQKELQKNQAEFQSISDSLREGLILVGAKGEISFINKSAMKILGMKDSPIGMNYREILPEEMIQAIESQESGFEDSGFLHSKSRTYRIETTALVSHGVKSGTSILLYDITRQLDIENRRREFTANVSHELKTPLHVISGSAELLKSGIVKDEDKQQFLEQIYNECQHMKRLIEDIIRLSKIEEREGGVVKEAVDSHELALTIKDSLSQLAHEKGITLTVQGGHTKLLASSSMLYSAIFNLVDNAIKYSDNGGHVSITTLEDEAFSYIKVADTGIGIAEEYQDRIFERFFRVDKSRSKANGGTGLGLAIVKHACIANDGDILVDSKPGQGTVFTLKFPRYTEG